MAKSAQPAPPSNVPRNHPSPHGNDKLSKMKDARKEVKGPKGPTNPEQRMKEKGGTSQKAAQQVQHHQKGMTSGESGGMLEKKSLRDELQRLEERQARKSEICCFLISLGIPRGSPSSLSLSSHLCRLVLTHSGAGGKEKGAGRFATTNFTTTATEEEQEEEEGQVKGPTAAAAG